MTTREVAEIVVQYLLENGSDSLLGMIEDIIAFAGTSRVARDACNVVLAREMKCNVARFCAGDIPYRDAINCEEMIDLCAMLTFVPGTIAIRIAFVIGPGLAYDDDFIEALIMTAMENDDIARVQFIYDEIVAVEPRIIWSVAPYVAWHENAHEFARILFDPRVLAQCKQSHFVQNINGVARFLEYLIIAARRGPSSTAQPCASAMRAILACCREIIAESAPLMEETIERVSNDMNYLAWYDCCDEIFSMCGKRDLLIFAIDNYFRGSRTQFNIARRFVNEDPTIVDDMVKHVWARSYMIHVSFLGDACPRENCARFLRMSHTERAKKLMQVSIGGYHHICNEYSRITNNIARALQEIARASKGSFRIDATFARFAIACAHKERDHRCLENALDICAALGLLQRVARDSQLAIYRKK